ncbi:ATP12 family chaperone protein [Stappia sp. ES.058]|uniref:ATP12 family chaperone protein n=1 Tax=Stappia sp. ES.058 TaxID=1881061 RepID=UPI00087D0BF5|nr:ATP12 family protein [Stappia sp. ES.058]SDU20455.1 Chaperone required for the assembly of the F1-ATPase [Stappia sp. ES.058]
MRDLLEELEAGGGAIDPVERAKTLSRKQLPKRFYTVVSVDAGADGFSVMLDGRPVKTAQRSRLVLPDEGLARRVADEWDAQEKEIDPLRMPLTRIANVALDAVSKRMAEVADDIAGYAGNDLLFYRAEMPDTLVQRQNEQWGRVLAWAEARYAGRFILAQGIMPVHQDDELIARIRERLEPASPLWLAALHVATTLTGSALLALALAHEAFEAEVLWSAAHLDEDWNIEQWGADEEAQRTRALRRRDFDAAALVLAATRAS